jgi:metallophosphoesterase superfamily enzyme
VLELDTARLVNDIASRKTLLARLQSETETVEKEKADALAVNGDLKEKVGFVCLCVWSFFSCLIKFSDVH